MRPRKPQPMADPRRRTEGSVFNFAAVEQSLRPRARIVRPTNGIEAVQDGRIRLGKCSCQRSEWTQFRHRMPMASSMGKRTPNALKGSRANV
jgi:hypothetical protein